MENGSMQFMFVNCRPSQYYSLKVSTSSNAKLYASSEFYYPNSTNCITNYDYCGRDEFSESSFFKILRGTVEASAEDVLEV